MEKFVSAFYSGYKHRIYMCYTQEMVDKLNEICEKYGLSRLQNITIGAVYERLFLSFYA